MRQSNKQSSWKVLSEFVKIKSPWLTLIGERLQDGSHREYDYWRVEKPDGMLVVTVQNGLLILPTHMYRPGIGKTTLDLCGGRIASNENLEEEALNIIERELGISTNKNLVDINPITKRSFNVDSSFTNVKIYAYFASISPEVKIQPKNIGATYTADDAGIRELLKDLDCLQCRAVLYEWKHSSLFKQS